MVTRHLVLAISIASVLAPSAALAAKQKAVSAPAPATTTAPSAPAPGSRTPGPMLRVGSPVANRTTIVPFPIPGDTSREAIAHSKIMNVPRAGETLVEPLDQPMRARGWKLSGSNLYWDPGDVTGPQQYDVFPEQLSETAPVYPKAARDAGIQGMVMVMAHVLADGTVSETKVVKSIPALDDAAVDAVKRLHFKPAMAQGKPVPVWVGVPVRFTIH